MLNIVILEECLESHLMLKFSCETPMIKVVAHIKFLGCVSSEFAESLGGVLKHLEAVEQARKHVEDMDTHVLFQKHDNSGLEGPQEFIPMLRKHLSVRHFAPTIRVVAWSSFFNRVGRPRYSN